MKKREHKDWLFISCPWKARKKKRKGIRESIEQPCQWREDHIRLGRKLRHIPLRRGHATCGVSSGLSGRDEGVTSPLLQLPSVPPLSPFPNMVTGSAQPLRCSTGLCTQMRGAPEESGTVPFTPNKSHSYVWTKCLCSFLLFCSFSADIWLLL